MSKLCNIRLTIWEYLESSMSWEQNMEIFVFRSLLCSWGEELQGQKNTLISLGGVNSSEKLKTNVETSWCYCLPSPLSLLISCVCVCVCACVRATRLLYPWDFSGKNTGVGWHFLLHGNLPDPGIKPTSPESPALQADPLPTESSKASP